MLAATKICWPSVIVIHSRRQAPKGDPTVAHTTRVPAPSFYPRSLRGGGGVLEDWGRPRRAEGAYGDPHKGLGSPLAMDGGVREEWVLRYGEGMWNWAAGILGMARSESGPCSSPELE